MQKITMLLLGVLLLSKVCFAAPAPILAKEEIQFVGREENKFIGLDKIDEFIGVIGRLQALNGPSKQVDLYQFKNLVALKSDSQLCSKVARRIFGPEKEISLKKTKSEIVLSASAGHFCSLVMTDPDPQALIKERHLFVKVLHAKVFGFVFRFAKAPTSNEISDAQSFIEGLR